MNKPTHLDLFSGIGGFALAAQSAGFETIGFSEIEPYACKVLKKNWPNIKNYGNIKNIPKGIEATLVTGGFPCQPFSVAGEQRGSQDDRYLWPEMCRVVENTRPTWVLGENVPGIIGMELDGVLDDLESIGYAARAIVIPACAVGSFQLRERVWICANNRKERGERKFQKEIPELHSFQRGKNVGISSHIFPRPDLYSPTLCSRYNGLSEELGGYGNAIVPQVAEIILKGMFDLL